VQPDLVTTTKPQLHPYGRYLEPDPAAAAPSPDLLYDMVERPGILYSDARLNVEPRDSRFIAG